MKKQDRGRLQGYNITGILPAFGKNSGGADQFTGFSDRNIDLAPVWEWLLYLNNSFQNKPDPVCVLHQMEYGFPFVIVLNMMRHRVQIIEQVFCRNARK